MEGCIIYEAAVNRFLVEVFHRILHIEETSLAKRGPDDLSVRETHVIEAVCLMQEQNRNSASDIAAFLGITPGSLTTSVGVLVKKKYLERGKDLSDGRRVMISATKKGQDANMLHAAFHEELVSHALDNLQDGEKAQLLLVLQKLASFFQTLQEKEHQE